MHTQTQAIPYHNDWSACRRGYRYCRSSPNTFALSRGCHILRYLLTYCTPPTPTSHYSHIVMPTHVIYILFFKTVCILNYIYICMPCPLNVLCVHKLFKFSREMMLMYLRKTTRYSMLRLRFNKNALNYKYHNFFNPNAFMESCNFITKYLYQTCLSRRTQELLLIITIVNRLSRAWTSYDLIVVLYLYSLFVIPLLK